MNNIFKGMILSCGILAAVGFVVSAVKKKRKERQEAQIDLDFSDVERAIDEYYERNGLQ